MAFEITNPSAGTTGNRRTVTGTWTGAIGDAAGSYDIGSPNVISADFDPNLGTGTPEKPLVSRSVSGNITTLSIYNKQTVTDGKFRVEFI